MTTREFVVRKGGAKQRTPNRVSDNLRSRDTVEAILGISEGPIKGLADDSAENYFLGETPLLNSDGESNFEDFQIALYPGSGVDEEIRPVLGGFSAPTSGINVTLAQNTPVVRSGQITNIDFIELRMVVQGLYRARENGDVLGNTVRFKIEYKPTSAPESEYKPAYPTAEEGGEPTLNTKDQNVIIYTGNGEGVAQFTEYLPGVRNAYWSGNEPAAPLDLDIWFDNAEANIKVKQWFQNSNSWSTLGTQPTAGQDFSLLISGRSVYVSLAQTTSFTPNDVPGSFDTYVWLNPHTDEPQFWRGGAWSNDSNEFRVSAAQHINQDIFRGGGGGLFGGYSGYGGGVVQITGKTTSTYAKEYRFPVERIDETYDIRVTKLSPDDVQEDYSEIAWESFQEVTASRKQFPNTAIIHILGRATDQFNGIPQFSGIFDGIICRVPSNYDEEERTYSGIWDGTWKMAYTNNPIWVWHEIQVNDRYGRSAYYPIFPNKWDCYVCAQWCDEKPKNQPRYTFNQWITEARGDQELSRFILGTCNAISTDDGKGGVAVRIDKPSNAVALFTPENVAEGGFTYSKSDIQTRHNDLTGVFKNPDMFYAEDRIRVYDQDHIDKYGRIPSNPILIGCRNRDEGVRRLRARLATGTKEILTVSFKTNRRGAALDLYDRILIADPKLAFSISGRVASFENAAKTRWKLRDPVNLEVGVDYTVRVDIKAPSGFRTIEVPLAGSQPRGEVDELFLAPYEDISSLADFAAFSLGAENTSYGLPKPFRVLNVSNKSGDPDDYTVTALEIFTGKYSFIDDGVYEDEDTHTGFDPTKVSPPRNLKADVVNRIEEGAETPVIRLSWDRSESKGVRRYRITATRSGGEEFLITETASLSYEVADPPAANYTFFVRAVSISGHESKPVAVNIALTGDYTPRGEVTDLRLVNGVSDTVYDVKTPAFEWQ